MIYKVEGAETTRDWRLATQEEVAAGYAEMAADAEREAEAFEWCESSFGDGLEADVWNRGVLR